MEKGKKIPDDYIIVGYDGVDISNYVYPSLSYVRQPFEKLADTIVDVLLRKINGENLTDDVVVNDVNYICSDNSLLYSYVIFPLFPVFISGEISP